ncbi:ATP-binding cassette domain-containing protein [Planococcus sp. ISL-109]|uniref:ATP-binding cassette domain-containing protein n=1 Tax=Planococcus sp. ISL-109 TaxID=2819166 RepID=UPI00333DC818
MTTLVGPSGAGKTTLLTLCNALLSPSRGELYIKSTSKSRWNCAGKLDRLHFFGQKNEGGVS